MALDEVAVLARIRSEVAKVTGIGAAYSAAATDEYGLPEALNDDVAALVFPGDTLEYIRYSAAHRHTYDVSVQVLCCGGTVAERTAKAIPFRVRLLDAFCGVAAANQFNSAIFVPPLQFIEGNYGGAGYAGWEMTLRVSEQANVTVTHGGAGS